MPDVVTEGRRVVNNLERSGSLFLVKNVFSVIMATFAIILSFAYPLVPSQISLVSMFTIGIPAFLLSQAPNHDLIRGNFVSNILRRAAPGGITNALLVGAMVATGAIFGLPREDIGVCSTILLACVGIQMIYRVTKKPFNWYKRAIILTCIAGIILCFLFLPWLFNLEPISTKSITLVIILAAASMPLLFFVGKIVDWVWDIPGMIKALRTKRKA
jgi:cation-transporting ATPase E